MAISGSIDLSINANLRFISSYDLLINFIDNGWDLGYVDEIYYLPLGDVDYDWKIEPISKYEEIKDVLKKKSLQNETIGVSLFLKDTNKGITVLFEPMLAELVFDLDIHRKAIDGLDVTDFTWYLEKIIPIIIESGLSIELIRCIDG